MLTVGLVTLFAGLLFAANAQLARSGSPESPLALGRQPGYLAELVETESARVTQLSAQVTALTEEIDALVEAIAPAGVVEDPETILLETTAIGFVPVVGPGVTVTLDDAPAAASQIPGVSPDDLVIHQQDLQAVIAALWAGGAEAMTLMGERVTMTSAFRCTGNVLLLHGQVFSPPYVIQAIGNPETLEASVLAAPGVQIFLTYVEVFGLGFTLTTEEDLEFPAYAGTGTLRFAELADGVQPWR